MVDSLIKCWLTDMLENKEEFSFDGTWWLPNNVMLQNWFIKRELLQPILDLYFTTVHNRSIPIHLEFLSYIQAIESYHRRTKKNKILSTEKFCKLKEEILSLLNEEQKQLVESKVPFANEPTLNDRLIDIFREYYEFKFFFSIDQDQFIRDIKNSRNYLTHYTKSLEKKSLKGADLSQATRILRAILQLLLLLELEFDRDGINKFTGKIHRWQLDCHSITFKI